MKDLLKKYYEMTDKEKDELEDLYLLHEFQTQLKEHEDLDLELSDEEIIFECARTCLFYSNIQGSEIISRLLNILECQDISVNDIDDLDLKELLELLEKHEGEFKEIHPDYEIIVDFIYGNFYCALMRNKEKYILVYDKEDNSHVDIYNNLEELLKYVIKNRLLSEGESIV